MITNLYIPRFRTLHEFKLQELVNVNYLTGENGSGKSLVLRYVLENFDFCALIRDSQSYTHSPLNTVILDKIPKINLEKSDYWDLVSFLPEIEKYYRSTGPERGGVDKIIKICKTVYKLAKYKKTKIFLLEEPENHLHPKLHKDFPGLLGKLANHLNIQFIVETHSPFLVSESSALVNFQEKQSRNYRSSFYPIQKVYFMKDGKIADKNGNQSIKGEYGYWGSKVNTIAGKMLGAGLMDLISPVDFDLNRNSPTVVFCEGQGRDEDEKFYNIVFRHRLPRVLFVSSRGSSQVESTFELLSQIRLGLSANFKFCMLRDRDHEFRNEQEIQAYEKVRPGMNVLYRRAIESYIYNSETARLLFANFNTVISDIDLAKIDKLSYQIQKEAEYGIKGDDYKERLKRCFYEIITPLQLPPEYYDNMVENLAKLITPDTQIYKELESIIFDRSSN